MGTRERPRTGPDAPHPEARGQADTVDLPQFVTEGQGTVGVAECHLHVPFDVARAFYHYDLPEGAMRGDHAHRATDQFVVCLAGAVEALLWCRNGRRSVLLDTPAVGLYVPPMTWLRLSVKAANTINLVLASRPYAADDYIRDPEAFAALIGAG